jgi:hypothetical protein
MWARVLVHKHNSLHLAGKKFDSDKFHESVEKWLTSEAADFSTQDK